MSEPEVKEVDVREKLEEIQKEEPEQTPELSADEQTELDEAVDAGYNPDGHDKDGNTLSPKEYMARKPLFNKIGNMRSEIDELRELVKSVQGDSKQMAKHFDTEKKNLVKQLKEQREQALTDLDTDTVRVLDKKIEDVGQVQTPSAPAYNEAAWNKSFMTFMKGNSWYDDKPGMKIAADAIGGELRTQNLSPDDFYNTVGERIRAEFPDRFKEKTPESKVSSTNRRATTNSKKKTSVKLSDLPAEEQHIVKVMATAVGKDANDCEEYLKNYKLED